MSSSMIRAMRSRSLIKALVCIASFEPLSKGLLRSFWCFILELQCSGLAQSSRSGPRPSQEPCQLRPASWLRARALVFKILVSRAAVDAAESKVDAAGATKAADRAHFLVLTLR